MGYFVAKQGPDKYTKRKASKDCWCLCCEEPIKKGEERYVESHRLNLCCLCFDQWDGMPHGTALGNIPRCKR